MKIAASVHLTDVDHGRANNLNLIRWFLASSVIFSHCYAILRLMPFEPMVHFSRSGATLGDVAVIGFFFLSGFLIFKSAVRHPEPSVFLRARVLRIFPGLLVAVSLTVFVVGPAFTSLSMYAYFNDLHTYRYLLNVFLYHGAGITLPGLFQRNTITDPNLPLWTLSSEWVMYLCALLACMAVRWRTALRSTSLVSWLMFGLALAITVAMLPLAWKYSWKWALAFVSGGAIYLLRSRIVLSALIAPSIFLLSLLLLHPLPVAGKLLFAPAFCYLLLVMAFHPELQCRWFLRFGDFSYGLYIYAWPLQQIFSERFHSLGKLFGASYAAALLIAVPSWYLVESPSLSYKRGPKIIHGPLSNTSG